VTGPFGDVVDEHLLDVNVPRDGKVPMEVYIAFPKSLSDPQVRMQVRRMWIHGNDGQITKLELFSHDRLEAVFRPVGVAVDWQRLRISVYTPSGLELQLPTKLLDELGASTEERVRNLNDYLYVEFKKAGKQLVIEKIHPLRGKVSTDVAREILRETSFTPLEVLVIGLGYVPAPEVQRLFLPRLLTWFRGWDGRPIHVAQFTLPDTAKTSWAIRCETLWNWRYIPEPPTLARLVLDARAGVLGEVFLRDGLVFDEFDKWDLTQPDRRHAWDALLTGMEQGRWERGVSAQGLRVPETPRLIPVVFFGNLGRLAQLHGLVEYNARAMFNTVYSGQLGFDVTPLTDRLAVIDACYTQIRITGYLTYRVLPDSVMRGLVQLLQEQVRPVGRSQLHGRLKRHADNVAAILQVLKPGLSQEWVDRLVEGRLELDEEISAMRGSEGLPAGLERD